MSDVGTPRWARDVVAQAVATEIARLTEQGVPGLATGDVEISGHAGVVQPVVRIRLPRHVEMPDSRRVMEACLPAGPTCGRHASAFATRALVPYARLLVRDVQLRTAGFDVDARAGNPRHEGTHRWRNQRPAWAYSISPIALARLRKDGLEPSRIVMIGLTNAFSRVHSQVDGRDYRTILERVEVASLDLGHGVRFRQNGNGVTMGVPGRLPQTVAMGISRYKGGPLREMLSHPLLDGLDLVVAGMDRRGDVVVRTPADVAVEPVPRDLGRAWIDIG
jgi:hypothetical protein